MKENRIDFGLFEVGEVIQRKGEKNMSKKLVALLLSSITAIMSLFLPVSSRVAPQDDGDFVPVVRFAVASDSHVRTLFDERSRRIQNVLTLAYSDADRDENYQRLDAVVFAGDLTDNGTVLQFMGFKATVDSVLRDETKLMAVVAKNHDGYTFGKSSLPLFTEITGQPSDYHYVVGGYHFIGLSASTKKGEHYSEYQRVWLEEQLAQAAKDDPEKPIFVTHHEPVSNTVYGSSDVDSWGVGYFKDILSRYPQVVDFAGHSHYPLNDPRSIWQGDFTAVGTGALKYAEFTVDGKNEVHPDGYKKIAQMWIVEVNAENEVRLRGFDALEGVLLCEYLIKNPSDRENRQYTPEQQQAAASAPTFSENAELEVKRKVGKYSVTVPAAQSTDSNPVFLYRYFVLDEGGEVVRSEYVMNNMWLGKTYESVSFSVRAKRGQTVSVVAENSYGMQSEALEAVLG